MSTIVFTLNTHLREMTDLKNPPLQFNGKPVEMSLRVSVVVENHSPGRVDVAIQSIRPGFGGGTGTRDEEKADF